MSDQLFLLPRMNFPGAAGEAFAVEVARFLDRTYGIEKPKQLFDLLSAFALNFDCPWVAYGSLARDQKGLKPVRGDPAVMLNYPDGWRERYFEMGYDKVDPTIKRSRRRIGAFRWSEVYNDESTTEDERRVLDEAATFGLRSGISVPLHGPDGSFAIMNFAQAGDGEFRNRTIAYLQLAALHFHLRVAEFADPKGVESTSTLSSREKECILWTAKGKSSWEIGKILGISVNTVNFHIKNVMGKMDANSRITAAIEVLKRGIVEL
ncbi:LuxR family transcriptional regulator [Mesorhizobium humile]|uniref:LuxR family transcriptional regulator n=1 Tax=Mesorhizobium humile TaxID=3072313 RepID=A0ABU4YN97_9HYPH|nr:MULTISPECIES: LuxR family transcriptional regulator [unclassified Mesorhizobium]MDX8463252.1 LuxR family transcriptional regulator [Mesorhizobium sp. VK2D]MDX8488404.1 LuxR family transcriptional regulator [Mesorhizobium sp. VK2B]